MPTRYSGHVLIPHLNILQNLYLHHKPLSEDERRTLYYDLELLPYTLGLCWHSVAELARIQDELSKAISEEEFQQADIHPLGNESRDRMTYAVDAFLDSARRAQNAVIHYLRRGFGKQFTLRMNKLVEDLKKRSIRLPDGLRAGLIKYWEDHGLRLKHYRDLAQHHALVTSDARLFKGSEGVRGMYFVLPNNPEVASPARLRFGNPPVGAFPYMANQLFYLVKMAHWVTEGLSRGVSGRMDIRFFRDGISLDMAGHPVPTEETFAEKVEEFRQSLEKRDSQTSS